MTERQFANNAKGQLEAGISSVAGNLLMKSGFEDRFPTHNGTTDKDYYLTLKKFATDLVTYTKQEIVLVTKRVGNNFTITRSAGYCPASTTATTQTNTAFAFDTDDYIEMTPNAEIFEELRTEMNLKAIDSEVVHNTGAEAVDGVKTFGSFPITPSTAPTTDYQVSNKKYIDDQIVIASKVPVLQSDNFRPGEAIAKGESVFVEQVPTFAESTSDQMIGDLVHNTRISLPLIGSGTAGTTLKLSLAKVVSPSVDFGVRIETDNSGAPSGTLADVDAYGTVTAGSLTTNLADTTVTLNGSITLTEGTLYHLVLFQGTYGSETVNATNYYKIGFSIENTTTRYVRLYDGSSRGGVENVKNEEFPGVAIDTSYWNALVGKLAVSTGLQFNSASTPDSLFDSKCEKITDITEDVITLQFDNSAYTNPFDSGHFAEINTYGLLYWDATNYIYVNRYVQHTTSAGVYVYKRKINVVNGGSSVYSTETITAIGDTIGKIEFSQSSGLIRGYWLNSGTRTQIGVDHTQTFTGNPTVMFSYSTNYTPTKTSEVTGVYVSTFTYDTTTPIGKFYYTTSDLYNSGILSLTNATYDYKIAWAGIASTGVAIGTSPVIEFEGLTDELSGMTVGALQYLSDTPGEVSGIAGTNESIIGQAVETDLMIFKNQARKAIGTSGGSATVVIGFYPVVVITSVAGGGNAYLDEQHISNKNALGFDISDAYDWIAMG